MLLDDVLPLHPTNVRFILSPDARVMLMNVPKEQSHLNGVVANQFNLFPARRRWHAARMSSAPPSPCLIIVDVQNDYVMATGALPCPDAAAIIPCIRDAAHSGRFTAGVYLSADVKPPATAQCASDERKGECVA